MRVLVTENDEILATTVAARLRREAMAVDVSLAGAAALEHPAVNRYDLTRRTFSGSPPRPHP
jgi:DNA-binding response OmpR family regulator